MAENRLEVEQEIYPSSTTAPESTDPTVKLSVVSDDSPVHEVWSSAEICLTTW